MTEAIQNADPAVKHGAMTAQLFPFRVALRSREGPPDEPASCSVAPIRDAAFAE